MKTKDGLMTWRILIPACQISQPLWRLLKSDAHRKVNNIIKKDSFIVEELAKIWFLSRQLIMHEIWLVLGTNDLSMQTQNILRWYKLF